MLELPQRALNRLEEEGMSSFNPADVERLRNNDKYVERQDVKLKRLKKTSYDPSRVLDAQPGQNTDLKEYLYRLESNKFNFRFWMHVYDNPGSQLDEAVTTVAKAFKWRKSYGVENLDDSALNRFSLSKKKW